MIWLAVRVTAAAVRTLHYPIGSQVGIGFLNEVKLMLLHPESPGNLISGNLIGYTSVSSQRFTLQVTRSHRIHVVDFLPGNDK